MIADVVLSDCFFLSHDMTKIGASNDVSRRILSLQYLEPKRVNLSFNLKGLEGSCARTALSSDHNF